MFGLSVFYFYFQRKQKNKSGNINIQTMHHLTFSLYTSFLNLFTLEELNPLQLIISWYAFVCYLQGQLKNPNIISTFWHSSQALTTQTSLSLQPE